jgi:hypothetical protein
MVQIGDPASLWVQFMNSCFFASGFFGDLLVLRFLLMFAYIFLLINVFTGYPMWPQLYNDKHYTLSVDSLVWGLCNLYLHGSGFLGIFRDERYIKLDESMEPLWHMMYRKSGLSALVFRTYVAPKFEVVRFSKDSTMSDSDGDDGGAIYIILDGATQATDNKGNSMVIPSGGVVGIRHLHLFSHRGRGYKAFEHLDVQAECLTGVTAYRCTKKDMEGLATTSQTKLAWQALLIHGLTEFSEQLYDSKNQTNNDGDDDNNSTTNDIIDGVAIIDVERNDVFGPLEDWEQPNPLSSGSGRAARRPLRHLIKSAVKSFLPPWPFYRWVPCLRHSQLPAPHFMSAAAGSGDNAETLGRSDFPAPIPDTIKESFTETKSGTVMGITTTLTAGTTDEQNKADLE